MKFFLNNKWFKLFGLEKNHLKCWVLFCLKWKLQIKVLLKMRLCKRIIWLLKYYYQKETERHIVCLVWRYVFSSVSQFSRVGHIHVVLELYKLSQNLKLIQFLWWQKAWLALMKHKKMVFFILNWVLFTIFLKFKNNWISD